MQSYCIHLVCSSQNGRMRARCSMPSCLVLHLCRSVLSSVLHGLASMQHILLLQLVQFLAQAQLRLTLLPQLLANAAEALA